jgi:hypothetical protein
MRPEPKPDQTITPSKTLFHYFIYITFISCY